MQILAPSCERQRISHSQCLAAVPAGNRRMPKMSSMTTSKRNLAIVHRDRANVFKTSSKRVMCGSVVLNGEPSTTDAAERPAKKIKVSDFATSVPVFCAVLFSGANAVRIIGANDA
eukprot:s381_g8.t1